MPNVPTRFPGGVSTANQFDFLSMFPIPENIRCNYYFNDFNTYTAADWTVTTTNSGTNALIAGNGGLLRVLTGATDTNYQGFTKTPAAFPIVGNCQTWFLVNFSISSATTTSYVIGLTNGGPSAPTDGIWFSKDDAVSTVDISIAASSSATKTLAVTTQQTAAMTLGFYYNGNVINPAVHVWSSYGLTASAAKPKFGGAQVKKLTTLTNLPLSTTNLAPQVYLVTTSGSATKNIAVDYLLCVNEIARF